MSLRKVPASCAGLDLEKAAAALLKARGSATIAAWALGVPAPDFRMMTRAIPRMIEAALEAEEQALDEADGVVRRALKSSDMGRRLEAAGHILRTSPAGRRRGRGRDGCRGGT